MTTIINITDDLARHSTRRYASRKLSRIDTIVVHHSATRPDVSIQAIARYHVSWHGWPGIGYHYVITDSGAIYQTNFLTTMSYHCGEHNSHTIGICLLGNFQAAPPPDEQIEAAAFLVAFLRDGLPLLTIRPHRALTQTACPGNTFAEWLNKLETPELPENDCLDTLAQVTAELESANEEIRLLNEKLDKVKNLVEHLGEVIS